MSLPTLPWLSSNRSPALQAVVAVAAAQEAGAAPPEAVVAEPAQQGVDAGAAHERVRARGAGARGSRRPAAVSDRPCTPIASITETGPDATAEAEV